MRKTAALAPRLRLFWMVEQLNGIFARIACQSETFIQQADFLGTRRFLILRRQVPNHFAPGSIAQWKWYQPLPSTSVVATCSRGNTLPLASCSHHTRLHEWVPSDGLIPGEREALVRSFCHHPCTFEREAPRLNHTAKYDPRVRQCMHIS